VSRFWRRRADAPSARPRTERRWFNATARPRAGATSRRTHYATSPLLASKTPPWRSKLVMALVGCGFALLIGRAVYIQIIGTDFYLKQGEMRYAARWDVPASRGRILDRNGVLLAGSVLAPSIWVAPKAFNAGRAERREFATLLGMSPADLEKRLLENPNFVWLAKQLDEPVAARIQAMRLDGVHLERHYRRRYPEGEAAAHVVGFTNDDQRGQEGVELAFHQELQGQRGTRDVVRDRFGSVIADSGQSVAPVAGRDVELSIDSKVQYYAYQRVREAVLEHKAQSGSAVVIDARSGEVLALANYPSFDPAERHNLSGAQLRNRALTDTFEPGSTIKPFIAAWAIETRRVTPNSVISTAPGRLTIGGSTISDAHPHGELTVAQVVQKSSNVGTVKMAMQLTPREMWELYAQLGFGQKPQLEFPGAVSGRLRPYKSWRQIEQATMSYGYGLSVSLFQLARAYSVFARDGELIPLTITKHAAPADAAGNVAPKPGLRVLSPETARAVREMLRMAAGQGGTAPKAQALGYSVGGKTGTAYKQEGKSYATNRYRAWFVGLAPVDKPRIVIAVMVDEPSAGKYYGGDVAAPVFSRLVPDTLRTLGVAPDLEVKPQIVTTGVEPESVEESF
jgi:cell division protein FtsI (penicillin-binding protein 3)